MVPREFMATNVYKPKLNAYTIGLSPNSNRLLKAIFLSEYYRTEILLLWPPLMNNSLVN